MNRSNTCRAQKLLDDAAKLPKWLYDASASGQSGLFLCACPLLTVKSGASEPPPPGGGDVAGGRASTAHAHPSHKPRSLGARGGEDESTEEVSAQVAMRVGRDRAGLRSGSEIRPGPIFRGSATARDAA